MIKFQECDQVKRNYEDSEGNVISRKKMKKMLRTSRKPAKPDAKQTPRNGAICENYTCPNPMVSTNLDHKFMLQKCLK